MFPHRSIKKFTWTSLDGKIQNHIDHILIDRWRSSILDVQSFRGAECDTDHSLVVAKLRERLAVSKQAAQKFDGERFNLKNLKELEVRKQYQIKISKRLTALEILSDSENKNGACEHIQEYVKTSVKGSLSLYELKQQKP
jgi:hypothetical protein